MKSIGRIVAALAIALIAVPAEAQNYYEPARGTQLRADLMDALRPHVEWSLGSPVEFVIRDLRVSGDVAFAQVMPQRPGGGEIDLATTPMVLRDGVSIGFIDGVWTQALYVRSGRQWVAVHHAIGATDVWYAWSGYCEIWAVVIPEVCR